MAAASYRCCRGPPLKYWVRYNPSRHHCRFHYIVSYTLGGTLLCWPLLHKIWSLIHQSRRCCSAEWDFVNTFPPNTPALFLSHLLCHCTHCPAWPHPGGAYFFPVDHQWYTQMYPVCRTSPHSTHLFPRVVIRFIITPPPPSFRSILSLPLLPSHPPLSLSLTSPSLSSCFPTPSRPTVFSVCRNQGSQAPRSGRSVICIPTEGTLSLFRSGVRYYDSPSSAYPTGSKHEPSPQRWPWCPRWTSWLDP